MVGGASNLDTCQETHCMKRYGFISETEESDLIDELIGTIKKEFAEVRFLEIGIMAAETSRGIVSRCRELDCPVAGAGVDFEEWRPRPSPCEDYQFYSGDSLDAWRDIPRDTKINFLMLDGCHCCLHASQDFLNYSPFVVVGGYILLHDTAKATKGPGMQDAWPQDHSHCGKSDSALGVREALKKLGLLDGRRTDFELIREIESHGGLMGIMLYRRTQPY